MEWTVQDLGAIGELIGGILVLATLVYLTLQVRSNTKTTQLTMIGTLVNEINETNRAIAADTDKARVWRVGTESPDELNEDESAQYLLLMGSYLNIHQAIFTLAESDNIDKQFLTWSRGGISAFIDTPGLSRMMRMLEARLTPEFHEYLSSIPPEVESDFEWRERRAAVNQVGRGLHHE